MRSGLAALVALVAAVPAAAAPAPPSRIVFAADRAPAQTDEVYRLPFHGRAIDLSRSSFHDTGPVVSPDGRWVAFVSDRSGRLAVYAVHPDGSGLRRISAEFGTKDSQADLAWAPDSRRIAIAWTTASTGAFALAGIGLPTRVLERDPQASTPSWSPDGRVATVTTSAHTLDAFTPDGRRAWQGLAGSGGWTRHGLYAGIGGLYVHVYDSQGRTVFSRPADSATWSPGGSLLAVRTAAALTVVDTRGRVVLSRHGSPFGETDAPLDWANRTAVVLYQRKTGNPEWLNVHTGTLTPHAWQSPADRLAVSADGTRTATAVQDGTSFEVHVTDAGVVGTVPGCYEDGSFGPAAIDGHFTPDGRSLVYQSACYEPYANLWSVAPGSQPVRLTNARAEETWVAASPDRSQLAFTWAQYTGLSCKGCAMQLWLAAADGSGARALTQADDFNYDTNPSWSPDGARLVYEYSTPDSLDLRIVPAAGGAPQSLGIHGTTPTWGPARIAFVGSAKGAETIETVLPDGTGRQRLAVGNLSSPAWSSDGRLAWVARPLLGGEPWLVLWANGTTTKVTVPFTQIADLAWSPDGTRLAVAARLPGTASLDVYTLALDGTHVTRLTHDVDALDVDWR